MLNDAPAIPDRGSYGLPDLKYGPNFGKVIDDLLSERFRGLVEKKFDIDLSKCPPCIVMMGNTSGHYNEGYSHPDSKHKIITVLVGFSWEWPYERGKLRVLRSDNRDDFAFEYAPEYGKMLMFRVCDHSWHGFLPHGQRGRAVSFLVRALLWNCRMSSMALSKLVAMSSCIFSGSSPSTKYGVQPQPRRNCSNSSCSMRARTVGLLILYPLRCRIGSTAPSVIGSRNLLDCHAVAKDAVSASPSPMMQATIRSGLSNAAPKAWLSEYPSSPPSCLIDRTLRR